MTKDIFKEAEETESTSPTTGTVAEMIAREEFDLPANFLGQEDRNPIEAILFCYHPRFRELRALLNEKQRYLPKIVRTAQKLAALVKEADRRNNSRNSVNS